MSLTVTLVDGEIDSHFTGIPIDGVQIGTYEIPLEHFCIMASHFLSGGWFGWGGETPESVNDALKFLFEMYKRTKDGKWVRRNFKEPGRGK